MGLGEVLVAMTAIILGCSVILIPMIGWTVRHAFKPAMEMWAQTHAPSLPQNATALERRLELLEEQVRLLQRETEMLSEDADFARRLREPAERAVVTGSQH